ncbi:sulfotransferase 1A1-like [Eriocheir sinensis]|uniref:sulfotransferase 1A1-like n=1 Tax=Eriocheir sinensis TaxID=95602 RepID=UPI0021C890F6|nr:sulfotransferase 1A1-like [Eriocheir sinensis]
MSKQLLSGHVVEELTKEEQKAIGFNNFVHGIVRLKPEGWVYPGTAPTFLDRIYNMEFRPDDVLITTFPKSGTSWMQEIIWTMVHNPKLDNPKAQESLWLRSPDFRCVGTGKGFGDSEKMPSDFLKYIVPYIIVLPSLSSLDIMFDLKTLGGKAPESYQKKFREQCPGKNEKEGVTLHLADAEPSPRILKSHYPFTLMPKDVLDRVKVVYVARNPKDMAISLFNNFKMFKVFEFESEKEEYFKDIMNNKMTLGSYCPYWPHVKEAWGKRHHPNLLFLFYEDMKADIMKELGRINEFLGTGLSQESLENVARHTSFSAMKSRGEPITDPVFDKKDDNEVRFFRKGTTGDWKNHFSPEMQKEFDQWIKENLAGSDLSLSWALAE